MKETEVKRQAIQLNSFKEMNCWAIPNKALSRAPSGQSFLTGSRWEKDIDLDFREKTSLSNLISDINLQVETLWKLWNEAWIDPVEMFCSTHIFFLWPYMDHSRNLSFVFYFVLD